MRNISGFSKELKRILPKKDPKSLGYLKLLPKLFCKYVLKPNSLYGILTANAQGI